MKVNLSVLSPLHIGSGIQYQGNAEYFYFDRENTIAIADERKILDIIGRENIHLWISHIEGGENNFLEYLRRRKSDLHPSDISSRLIKFQGNRAPKFSNSLRGHIFSALGSPYIPGSSIKGAIRTAIFATALFAKYNEGNLIKDDKIYVKHGKLIKDTELKDEVFGKRANEDWMRMLHIGDCYIQNKTNAGFVDTLNEGSQYKYRIKTQVQQLIEYLPEGSNGQFDLNIPENQLKQIKRVMPDLFGNRMMSLNLKSLLALIHNHTIRLLEDEINFFEDAELPESVDGFFNFLKDLYDNARKFKDNECLLRLGFGTGYRSMTGNWVKDLIAYDNTYDAIAAATRRTPRYNGSPLPKSRKIVFDGVMLGFVKLSI